MLSVRSIKFLTFLMAGIWLVSGCSETKLLSHWAKKITWPGQKESMSAYKVGSPYKIDGIWYYPKENFTLIETGVASWYGPGFHEEYTANGEIFDQNELTAAHRTLQLPSIVRVTNLENGRSVVVRVNDRGPFKQGRIMDVSKRTAELLGFAGKGTAHVRLKVLEKESRNLAAAAQIGKDTTRLTLSDLRRKKSASVKLQPSAKLSRVVPVSVAVDGLPESLITPTIATEELAFSKKKLSPAPSVPLFTPAPVVMKAPVNYTDIFVQAGSFSVFDNAERLTKQLVKIAPTVIEPATVRFRKMYRVKLGPLASIEEAEKVLEKVISSGQTTAKIIIYKK